ncbi:MAG TPA: NAD-dependent epimerase/dehydratase family protein [Candidatus Dormibacteraeota bacterium]|nr:NAD-dependent epimerase/dehydratase family protein [Candidatus Dormibacteraeota bacterium]
MSVLDPRRSIAVAGRRVLVTGGLGFLGFNLVRALTAAGARVSVLSRSWPPPPATVESMLEEAEFFHGDIRDPALVDEAVIGRDLIYHMAGKSGPAASNVSPMEDLEVNARGTLILLEACRRLNPKVKIVFPSSRLVYEASPSQPTGESAPTGPRSVYGVHKWAAEQYLLLYQRLYGLRVSILRITNPYGPFQRPEQNRYGVVNWFIHQAMQNRALTVYGGGEQLRDYIHVDDVVDALLVASGAPEADGMIFNVGCGRGVPFLEMAEIVVKAAGRGWIEHVAWPRDAAVVETGDFIADISLIKERLGWRPAIPLESGIEDVVQRYAQLEFGPDLGPGLLA